MPDVRYRSSWSLAATRETWTGDPRPARAPAFFVHLQDAAWGASRKALRLQRLCRERAHEGLHAVVEGDEGAELHDLRLAVVPLELVVERRVDRPRRAVHVIGIAQRALLRGAKAGGILVVAAAGFDLGLGQAGLARARRAQRGEIGIAGRARELNPD